MATNTLHNALCVTAVNLFKNLLLRIAIVRSAWRQPNIFKHTSTVSCDLVLKIFQLLLLLLLLLLLHPFNGLFSGTTWVSRYQKDKTGLDLNEARDDEVLGRQWHQQNHTETICTYPDRLPRQHLITQFLQAGCFSRRQTNCWSIILLYGLHH